MIQAGIMLRPLRRARRRRAGAPSAPWPVLILAFVVLPNSPRLFLHPFFGLPASPFRSVVAAAAAAAASSFDDDDVDEATCSGVDGREASAGSCAATTLESIPPADAEAGDVDDDDYDDEVPYDPCPDLHPSCPKWAAEGECRNNPGYMLSSCARSCRVCPAADESLLDVEEAEAVARDGGKVDCEDRHELCGFWAAEGECAANPGYMGRNCAASCVRCLDSAAARERGDDEETIRRKRLYMNTDLGKPNIIESSDEEMKEEVRDVMKRMDEYSKTHLMDAPDVTRRRCRNAFSLCVEWAARGMCEENVVFMLANCPLACMMCDETESFHRCTGRRHPSEQPAFEKGGINKMFEAIKGGKWDQYGPEFVTELGGGRDNNDPYIVRFDKFLTEEETDRLIEVGSTVGWHPSPIDDDKVFHLNAGETPHRRSLSARCDPGDPCEYNNTLQDVMERIARVTGVPNRNLEGIEFEMYGPRDSRGLHHDARLRDEWSPAGHRALTFLLFLSDVREGGSEGFPELDWLFIRPKRGQALLWSNVRDDDPGRVDRRMVHEGLPVARGRTYVANVYAHLFDWRDALEQGCA